MARIKLVTVQLVAEVDVGDDEPMEAIATVEFGVIPTPEALAKHMLALDELVLGLEENARG